MPRQGGANKRFAKQIPYPMRPMRSVNKVILIGNLTRDPEMRQTPNGQGVTTFTVATNREWMTRDNKKQSLAEYHELVAWAKLAEICFQYLKKGKLVYIEGYLKTRSWETPEGIKKFKTEIVVQDMIMLDKRTEGEERPLPTGIAVEETSPKKVLTGVGATHTGASNMGIGASDIGTANIGAAAATSNNFTPTTTGPAIKESIDIDEDLGL